MALSEAEAKLLDEEEGQSHLNAIHPVEIAPSDLLTITCTNCEHICESQATFCSVCGHPLQKQDIAPPSNEAIAAPLPAPAHAIDNEYEAMNTNEGQMDSVQIVQIVQVQDLMSRSREGRAPPVCRVASCQQLAVRQCSICDANVCNAHCNLVVRAQAAQQHAAAPPVYECVYCSSHQVLQQRAMNRGVARCCVRRLIIRLIIFLILVIVASLYSSN